MTDPLSRRSVLGGAALGTAMVLAGVPDLATASAVDRRRHRHRPTLILLNGDVRLMDRRTRSVPAIALRYGRVLEVGTSLEIRRLAGPRTEIVDLEGRTALPGINDSHVHGLAAGVSLPPLSLDVAYPTVGSIADIVASVAEAVRTQPPGSWVRGNGWNTALLLETRNDPSRLPTAPDLDPVSPDSPVVLRDFSFHTVWANSKAMELAGITKDTPTPPGGVIDRDANGNPIGLFRENAQPLVLEAVPALTLDQQRDGLRRAISVLLSQGITSYTDPGLTPDEIDIYRDALTSSGLGSRVTLMLSSSRSLLVGGTGGGSVDLLDAAFERYPNPRVFARRLLNLRGVKVFGDGVPRNHTSWVYEPYVGTDGVGGLVVEGDTDLERTRQIMGIVMRAHAAGFQVGTHSTGDRTCDVVTAAYIRAIKSVRGNLDPRHYTIHSDLITDDALRRLSRYGLGANMNPSIKAAVADAVIGVLGEERASRQWPTRSALHAGVTLTSASDWPVTQPNWRAGVVSAVLRQDQISGNVSGPEQRLSLEQALRTYISAPARQDGAERWKGRLLPGMAADICVLDGTMPRRHEEIEQLAEIPVALTVFDGSVAYERSGSAVRGAASTAGVSSAATTSCRHGRTCCCQRAPELLAGKP